MTQTIIEPNGSRASDQTDRWFVGTIYVLYILGIPTAGLSLLLGAIIAYARKPTAPHWLREHYEFQIWTALYTVAYVLVSVAMIMTLIGVLVGVPAMIIGGLLYGPWILIRSGVGLYRLIDGRGQANPRAWLI
jgi:uncharacterized membrane protein